jgi:hypothetical protein
MIFDDGSTLTDIGGVITSTDAPAGNLLSDLWNPSRTGMVSSSNLGGGGNWESWIQSAATGLMGGYVANKQANNNFELEKLKLQQRGSTGQFFTEGQPSGGGGGGLAISGPMLLIGGAALLAVLMMKD